MKALATALVGLGANIGDAAAHLRDAATRIGAIADSSIVARSTIYESRPLGPPQPNFCNAVLAMATALQAEALLDALQGIERAMGRVRRERWGPRTIDLDLLAWVPAGSMASIVRDGGLELPHPRMAARDFVLVPLAEVWPQLEFAGLSVAAHLSALPATARTIVRALPTPL